MCDTTRAMRIRELNDAFRTTLSGGRVLITAGIIDKGAEFQRKVLNAVCAFTDFDQENDPYGEHDFGAIDLEGQRVFWKVDYYDQSMEYGSEDPSDPTATSWVLTIMMAEEY